MKKILNIIKKTLLIYLIYFLVSTLLLVKIPINGQTKLKYDKDQIRLKTSVDTYVKMFEDTKDALDIRLSLIENAKESIDISYYQISIGDIGEVILGSLLKKADEGVKVRILVDGLNYEKSDNIKTLVSHENISEYIYEKFNPLIPYAFNNIYHDKLLIVDKMYGLTGGRNITERFLNVDNDKQVFDRDILVYGINEAPTALIEMDDYYNEVLNSKYVKEVNYKFKDSYINNKERLITKFDLFKGKYQSLDKLLLNSTKVDNAIFVRSPLNRLNKEPVLFNLVKELINEELLKDDYDVKIQSPYFTPNREINKYYKGYNDKPITFITNNRSTNPNFPALTGYELVRKKIAKNNDLYEHQGLISHHAKSITIGSDISIIGTQNMDNRSIKLSTESSLIIYSKEFNSILNESFNNIISESLRVDKNGSYILDDNVVMVERKNLKMLAVNLASIISMLFTEML